MTARVTCMASAKGGSGKTVLTATFGTFLSAVGKKVLMIDTDAATNGLTLLYAKEVMLQAEYALAANRQPRGVYESVNAYQDLPEIVKLKSGPDLVPATYVFKNTEQIAVDDYERSLRSILEMLQGNYDYIFLDAQAGSDVYAQIAMNRRISDEVVIVSEYDPMSAAGVERLKGLFREDLTYVRTWVLLNKMLPDFVQSFSDFLEVAKYLSPIPWDANVVRAYARRRLALDVEQGNEHTIAVLQTLRGLFGEGLVEQLDEWLRSRATKIREPLDLQYRDAEMELAALFSERERLLRQRIRKQLSVLAFITSVGVLLVFFFLRVNDLLNLSLPTWFTLVMTISIIGFFIIAVQFYYSQYSSLDMTLERGRLERRVEYIQQRLRMLESLKDADVETLIRDSSAK